MLVVFPSLGLSSDSDAQLHSETDFQMARRGLLLAPKCDCKFRGVLSHSTYRCLCSIPDPFSPASLKYLEYTPSTSNALRIAQTESVLHSNTRDGILECFHLASSTGDLKSIVCASFPPSTNKAVLTVRVLIPHPSMTHRGQRCSPEKYMVFGLASWQQKRTNVPSPTRGQMLAS
jgi:hypothetical protein